MLPPESNPGSLGTPQGHFASTSWTNVLAARQAGAPEATQALETLCATYWYPLYAYARRKGADPHKAQDLTQGFFYKLLKENYLDAVDRRLGRFRSFLLACFSHFISNERDHERALKRGGGVQLIPLPDAADGEMRFLEETEAHLTPERVFERNWFRTLFDNALATLRRQQAAGREELFDQLKEFIVQDAEPGDYRTAAARLNMTPNAVAVTVHRWRDRYRKVLQDEIVRTVGDPSEVDEELRRFYAVMERR